VAVCPLAAPDGGGIEVGGAHAVPSFCQTRRVHRSQVPGAENRDLRHPYFLSSTAGFATSQAMVFSKLSRIESFGSTPCCGLSSYRGR